MRDEEEANRAEEQYVKPQPRAGRKLIKEEEKTVQIQSYSTISHSTISSILAKTQNTQNSTNSPIFEKNQNLS